LISDIEHGWLRGARQVRSPNFDARPDGVPIELIVVHAISLPPGEFGGPHVEELFCNCLDPTQHPYFADVAQMRVSAHFLIQRSGALTQFVSLADRAWHAGISQWRGRSACNDFSIGIELEGTDDQPFTDTQYAVLRDLVVAVAGQMPEFAADRIVGHSDIAPTRKTDPGPYFDWARLRGSLST
jgi:N-acetyl-anhydromuramoyl-L-alanine amidase